MLGILALLVLSACGDVWDPVRKLLDNFPATTNGTMSDFAFSVGNSRERVFTHQVGQTTMTTVLSLASASKFPAANAILGAVAAGHLALDEPVNKYVPYWTTDPADPRSKITLRDCLTFRSGYFSESPAADLACANGLSLETFDECVKQIQEKIPLAFTPGTTFDYNSYHLQIAGAMAAHAAGMSIGELLDTFLIKKLNMTHTTYGERNPILAASMRTTGDDYDKFLRAYLAYELTPQDLTTAAEHDYTKESIISNSTKVLTAMIGHYGFAHWLECLFNGGTFSQRCADEQIHSDEGLFGYYPLIDRKQNYYFQIVYAGKATNTSDFGPTTASISLRLTVKPMLDEIMATINGPTH